jgi:hypothetical protein
MSLASWRNLRSQPTRQLAAQPTVFAGHLAPDRHDLILAEAGIHQVDDEQTGDCRGTNLSRRMIITNAIPCCAGLACFSKLN